MTTRDRFWAKVLKGETCWTWTGARNAFGYGVFTASGKFVYAHRFSFELNHSPIPPGMCVLHRCDNPSCVRPDHLFLGTDADNMKDRKEKGRYATGTDSWSANHKDRLARGDRHGLRRNPERAARGERHGSAKLTSVEVDSIRSLLSEGRMLHREIASMFGVTRSTVTAIKRGKNWARPRVEVEIEEVR